MEKYGKMKRKKHRRYCGRHLMLLGAVALLIWAGYELWIRIDDFRAWTGGVRYMSALRQESFLENLRLILEAPEMRELTRKMLFLAGCVVFSGIGICLRNKPRADVAVFLLDAALIVWGRSLKLFEINFSLLPQTLKVIPLLLILAGCVLNFIQYCVRMRRRRRRRMMKKHPVPESRPRSRHAA